MQELSETARIGVTYAEAKQIAAVEGVDAETVKQWARDGMFLHAYKSRGETGRWHIAVRSDGRALRKGEGESDDRLALDVDVVRAGVREVAAVLGNLPPIPDPAQDALARGEPAVVVARRVEARGKIVAALILSAGLIVAVFVAAFAYLRRHGLIPSSR